MSNTEQQLLSLIELMTEMDPFQGDRLLFDQLNQFFHQKLGHDELVVLSGAKVGPKNTKKGQSFYRILYNKSYFNKSYPVNEIENILKKFQPQTVLSWEKVEIEKDNYLFIFLGESKKQNVTGVFKLNEEIKDSLLDNFCKMISSLNKSSEQLKQYKKMEELVYTDDVTGLFNQRKLNQDLESAILKHGQIKDKFAILFIDMDHFKSVNDGHGHLVGTKILFDLAALLNCAVRESDYIYRYGGDEFVVLIPNTGPEVARTVGERILNTVKDHTFEVMKPGKDKVIEFKLSVSIGVASFPADAKTREDILEIADQMMYQAKKSGRGRVCFTHDIFESTVLESSENNEKMNP